jgi:hypothetical protein
MTDDGPGRSAPVVLALNTGAGQGELLDLRKAVAFGVQEKRGCNF